MRLLAVLVIVALLALLGWLFLRRDSSTLRTVSAVPREAGCPKLAPVPVNAAARLAPEKVRWLAVGAVESPEANQVSIEQDIELLRKTLGTSGVVLLAGGAAARDVQVQLGAREKRGDPVLLELADLFAPRGGRWSRYRRGAVARHGAATLEEVQRTLGQLLGPSTSSGPPLLLYLGGHGEAGQTTRQGYVSLWGGERLTVEDLARELDVGERPLRLVVTTCYAGAFAEALFRDADPESGVAPQRCGFFATAADLPASGCDPNPDRSAQEGYALHFFNALRGRDSQGERLALAELDLDGDGHVSLAEAHARARIGLDAVDVPLATSERWLRQAAPGTGRRAALPLPEERAVVRALSRRTKLPEQLAAVSAELASRERLIDQARQELERESAAEDHAARRAMADLLARWPVLDDPWHPEFAELWRCQRRAIESHLRASHAYSEYLEARDAAADAERHHWEERRQAALVERLLRALETIERAERLRARGGAAWRTYEAILACERERPRGGP
jgi:hypothetical protein